LLVANKIELKVKMKEGQRVLTFPPRPITFLFSISFLSFHVICEEPEKMALPYIRSQANGKMKLKRQMCYKLSQ